MNKSFNKFALDKSSLEFFLAAQCSKYNKIAYFTSIEYDFDDLKNKLLKINPKLNVIEFPSFDCLFFSNLSPTNKNKSDRINCLHNLVFSDLSDNIIIKESSIDFKREIGGLHQSYIIFDRNSQEQGKIRLYDEDATTTPALTLTGVHPINASSPIHRTIDMKTGIGYFENNWSNSIGNNNRAGVIGINNANVNTPNDFDILNINSEWDITSSNTPKINLLGCTNSTSTISGVHVLLTLEERRPYGRRRVLTGSS